MSRSTRVSGHARGIEAHSRVAVDHTVTGSALALVARNEQDVGVPFSSRLAWDLTSCVCPGGTNVSTSSQKADA